MINSLKRTEPHKYTINGVEYDLPTIENAIHNLVNFHTHWTYDTQSNTFISFYDKDDIAQPTKSEIDTEFERLLKIYAYFDYARRRQDEFGDISHQLGLLFDDIENGKFGETAKTGTWYTKINNIKSSYTKPAGEPENYDISTSNDTYLGGNVNSDGTPKT